MMGKRMTFRYDGQSGQITTTMSRKDFNKMARLPLNEGGAERLDEFRTGAVEYLEMLEAAERAAEKEQADFRASPITKVPDSVDGGDGRA